MPVGSRRSSEVGSAKRVYRTVVSCVISSAAVVERYFRDRYPARIVVLRHGSATHRDERGRRWSCGFAMLEKARLLQFTRVVFPFDVIRSQGILRGKQTEVNHARHRRPEADSRECRINISVSCLISDRMTFLWSIILLNGQSSSGISWPRQRGCVAEDRRMPQD